MKHFLFKICTVVTLLTITSSTYARKGALNNPIFKQIQQDMLVFGMDFEYLHSTKKSFQVTEIVEPEVESHQEMPEEIEHALGL